MNKSRLEAFSDGVIAILITIMVLDLHMPHEGDWASVAPLVPVVLRYLLSFIYLGIYWSNHHHMLHATKHVTGGILWANLHLLFWLSLIPATTAWLDETRYTPAPTALYGAVLFMASVAYWTLQQLIIRSQGEDSLLKRAVRGDWKGKLSMGLYAVAVVTAYRLPVAAMTIYGLVALLWLVPDRRIERVLSQPTG